MPARAEYLKPTQESFGSKVVGEFRRRLKEWREASLGSDLYDNFVDGQEDPVAALDRFKQRAEADGLSFARVINGCMQSAGYNKPVSDQEALLGVEFFRRRENGEDWDSIETDIRRRAKEARSDFYIVLDVMSTFRNPRGEV